MSSFTDNFFSNSNNKSTSNKTVNYNSSITTSTNKKKKEYDTKDFTKSFFEDSENTKTYFDTGDAFTDEYNDFIHKLNGTRSDYYKKKQEDLIKQFNEQASSYYESNKENLKKQRSEYLTYNWDFNSSGGSTYDYGAVPIQNEKGYLKTTDKDGNVYWTDAKEDLLYDSNGKLINDERLKDEAFINSLKYEYDTNAKSLINVNALNKKDRTGLTTIDYDKYKFLVDDEHSDKITKKNVLHNTPTVMDEKLSELNLTGLYLNTGKEDEAQRIIDSVKNKPKVYTNVYATNFEKLNKAIENGDFTTANNALQEINMKYFGHQIEDGWYAANFKDSTSDILFFKDRFDQNVEKLNIINDSLKNTEDIDTIEALEKEKNKLELENTLIQYNRIYAIQSDMALVNKMEAIMNPSSEAWDKVGQLWGETFSEFDDGYDFGDIFKTGKKVINNLFQTVGAGGKQVNSTINALEVMSVSDMDDSEFKDTWLPAIMDVATYMIPYVGQARFAINMAEPASVIEAGITREGSATIDSKDGTPRVPDFKNVVGASVNIAANYASSYIFGKIRSNFSKDAIEKFYNNSGRAIFASIFKEGLGEGAEEFIQTYAEAMQNMEGDLTWEFFKENTDEALKSALIAFVTASGASAASISIGAVRGSGSIETNSDAVDNIRINRNIKENSNTTLFNASNNKNFEKINNTSTKNSNVNLKVDDEASIEIAESLQNNNIVTILDTDAIKSNQDKSIDLNNSSDTTILSDIVINDNIKTVLVPSKELETYIKNLRDDLTVYTFDPKSETFMDDVKEYVSDVGKSNIVTKNVSDFTPNDYTFTPNEMTTINKMVNDYLNRGNVLDSINNPNTYKLSPITVSDITDSDINTIMNSIKTKFLNEITNNNISKETAKKEYASLSKKLTEYYQNTKQNRTYIRDDKGSIITFAKRGSNIYEAVNTLPRRDAELEVFANVKTNGNIINGNLNKKVDFAKKQLNAVNTLIDKLGLRGNYLTPNSTYKDVASLIKSNLEFSKDILQALGADGLIEGKTKTRLYTAFNDLDNANPKGAIQNTANYVKSAEFKKELDTASKTTAPSEVNLKVEESKVSIEEKPLDVEKYAINPENTSELNNIELEKLINDSFGNLTIKDKIAKYNMSEIKDFINNGIFDGYSHIADIANTNEDYNVKRAIYDLQAVASDAQTMINGAQMNNGEVIGKSLKQIYSDNKIKSKKEKTMFEKTMLHALNAERERAGVDKIFENISAKQSDAIVNKMFEQHKNFKEAANDLQRYNNNLLDMLVDGGVINKELSNKLKNRYKYYMPIYSSDLATFAKLDSNKYLKDLKVDDTIKDVTKTSKNILSLEKSMENKTYNVLSAIAKNKLANEISKTSNYAGDSDLIFYTNGKINKTKVTNEILNDISNNNASHIADKIHSIPVLKQLIDFSNMSYKFILDPVYQLKNITIDVQDSLFIYSKDKKRFLPNYFKAIRAVANNSELFHEALNNGLGKIGEGWTAPKIEYDANGNITTKQNKFQRIYANLEAMPKLAEYISLKDKYMKQAKKDYDAGKYKVIDNHFEFNNDEQYAINKWVGTDSYAINEHYRYGYDIDERLQNISDNMDSVLTKIKSESGEYHRSIPLEGDRLQQFINKYQKGKTVTEEAFTSMTPKGDIYDDSFNVQVDITSKNAKDTHKLMRKSENEYMLQRNTKFRVDDVNIDGNNVYLKLTDVTDDKTTIFKNNISFDDISESIKTRAMIDASDVNLNFNRGGKVTKALSKSGFKFLNAGVQGFDKFVTHVSEGVKTPKGMGSLLLEFTAVGVGTAVANQILNGDDEDYDKLPYYYKNNYYMFKVGNNQFFRIPKGRVQALYNVLFEYGSGLRKEDSAQDYIDSLFSAFDSAVMPPALENASPISVYKQLFENKDAFGNEIYSNKYDTTEEKVKKSIYHLFSNYFGRYGRIVKDVTDGDSTTDLFNEFDFYKDTTKANRHYQTVLNLVDYYQNKDNVKTLDDKAIKKYVDTQNYNLRGINSEINSGKNSGQTTKDLEMKYAARDDLLLSIINNHKNFDKEIDANGNTWYYFDDLTFMYNEKTGKFVKK